MTTVLIVSDVRLYRDGLADILGRHAERVSLVGTAADASNAALRIEASCPDVLLLDLGMPGALEAIRIFHERASSLRIIALGVPETETAVLDCALAGAAGYVHREGSLDDLMAAITSVQRDEFLCSPKAAAALLRQLRTLSERRAEAAAGAQLTRQELKVMRLAAEGLSNKAIARQLAIRPSTVKNHMHNALEKLDTHRRGEAVAKLIRAGILTPQHAASP
jgi:DNA-binding NarL/FixJ family response regulator